jgi:hypothetical protein
MNTLVDARKAHEVAAQLAHELETHSGAVKLLPTAEWLVILAGRIVDDLKPPASAAAPPPAVPVDRRACLELAKAATSARLDTYGRPESSFATIAQLWSTLFGHQVEPHQVALALDLLKTARLMSCPNHVDSWVDKAGYAACGAEVATAGGGR